MHAYTSSPPLSASLSCKLLVKLVSLSAHPGEGWDVDQLVEHWTEKPGAVLTLVSLSIFSADSLAAFTQLPCAMYEVSLKSNGTGVTNNLFQFQTANNMVSTSK